MLLAFVTGPYHIFLTDFSFMHDNKTYNITLGRKGNHGQWYRLSIDNKNYISNNVWQLRDTNLNPEYQIAKIEYNEIRKDDIVINTMDFIQDVNKVIDYYINKINEETKKEQADELAKELFWSNKQILMTLMDDGSQYFIYIMKIDEDVYHYILCHEPIFPYMHRIYDDYIQGTANNLNDITKIFMRKLESSLSDLPSPLYLRMASKYMFEKIKSKYTISNLKKIELSDCYAKEMSHEFEIKLNGDDSDSSSW